ncbi:aminoglycoside phosphotransferase family protein [Neobacillus terrae]|uniref:aminoglycoside phosphotransferase family protein n=1 Tax=Neobacillus terrae TaxID=3034837 RepID=UPI00140C4F2F|nr:aminoglycoside phosphotransferase family protein [Neobacillus terrae]NHM32683.1 hypothetical protein [Neobacillus terrae]
MLTESFKQTLHNVHGEKGRAWMDAFPGLLQYCEKHWNLTIGKPFSLSYNYVAPAVLQSGHEAVLKLCVPGDEFLSELQALQLFQGRGMVELFDYNRERGVLLLERILPGNPLADLEDDSVAVVLAAKALDQLWAEVPLGTNLPSIKSREESMKRIERENKDGLANISAEHIKQASALFTYMIETSEKEYLLHGDFHHFNLLKNSVGDWTVIDPKGLIGEREYDLIQYFLNKWPQTNLKNIIRNRAEIFTRELKLNKKRLFLWGYCHSVLSSCWSAESGHDTDTIRAAEVFRELLLEEHIVLEVFK